LRDPSLILVVDDNLDNREILEARLGSQGYATVSAVDGEEALWAAREHLPDLILLDVMMPKLDGFEVCRQLRADSSLPFMPIILVTAKVGLEDVVQGLEAGADEYLTKPFDHAALVARVRSILRIKALHDEVQAQAAELAAWNRTLEQRVAEQVKEIERTGRLRRFLSPQVTALITADEGEGLLESHRREVTVVFCDLRGFTAFAEQASPEQVMGVLHDYHAVLGPLIHRFEGTLERFLGDGLMVLFNDPVTCPDPAERAVRMAVAMREAVDQLAAGWRERGFALGFGIGIAQGEATLGRIGFEGRYDYAAIGRVSNLSARLCAEAADRQILVSQAVGDAVTHIAVTQSLAPLTLKGFAGPVPLSAIATLKDSGGMKG
jgi:class 3 adenylate cyclase/CheY-like chemotaxis protein